MGAIIDYINNYAELLARIGLAISAMIALLLASLPILSNIFSLATLPEVFYGLLAFGKKKRRQWGIAYEIDSGMPIPFVKILLLDAKTKRLIEISVTDKEGRYGFIQGMGDYLLKIDKQGYHLADLSRLDKISLPYTDNYQGQIIGFNNQNEFEIRYNLPLKSDSLIKHFAINVKVLNSISSILYFANWPIIVMGTIFSFLALYLSPNIFNLLVMCGYILVWIYQISIIRFSRSFGRVLDAGNHRAVDLSLVRVLNVSDQRLVRTAATNHSGHYTILIGTGDYRLVAQKSGYTQSKSQNISVKSGLKAINHDLYLSVLPEWPGIETGNKSSSEIQSEGYENAENYSRNLS